jgi:hypothetical protein
MGLVVSRVVSGRFGIPVLLTGQPFATLTRQNVLLWLAGPVIASVAVAIYGLLMLRSPSRRFVRMGLALTVLGALGIVASAAWIALALYVEKVVR